VRTASARAFPDPTDPAGAVVLAILIGDRSALDDEIERRLQIAGTYHVIAISGGNVALLTALLFLLLRMIVRSAALVSALTIAGVIAYGWIVGGEPSVTRAVTAAVIYLACGVAGLSPRSLDALATVALLVVVTDPMAVIDAGAWLSFGATLGIVVGARRVTAWHDARRPAAAPSRGRLWAVGLCGATMAAELAILPVNAALFARVGVAGLALNLIAIPMIAVVQIAGAASVLLAEMWEPAAASTAALARWATRAILSSSALVDVLPWLSWRVPPPPGFVVAGYYAAGIASLSLVHRRGRRLAAALCLAAGCTIATAPLIAWRLPPAGWLRVTMMDVGQGEAILLQFPSGQSMLVDAGGATARFDTGDRIVTPAVWASGVARLDWLAFTHADLDHIGGAAAVASVLRPREIWEGIPVPPELRRQRLRELARRRGMVWRQLQRDDRFEAGGVAVEVRSPERGDWERQRVRNDDSLVLSIRYGDAEIMLTGDVGDDGERRLSLADPAAPLRVLKVAHHGSRSSSSQRFLDRYRPQVALISAGRANPFGHPSQDVLDRLRAIDAETFRTDADGAVIVETDGRELFVRSMTGRRWRVRVVRSSA
jgi:competence protein ComEC